MPTRLVIVTAVVLLVVSSLGGKPAPEASHYHYISLLPKANLKPTEAMARGLFAVAKADGMHEREAALVAAFFTEAGGSVQALGELERREPITSEELQAVLTTSELRRLFLKTAVLLTWADGRVTQEERELVKKYKILDAEHLTSCSVCHR